MKTLNIFTIIILFLHFSCCKKDIATNQQTDFIEVRVLSVHLHANLEPPQPPDPILCRATAIVKNTSSSVSISGLSISEAEVRLDSANQYLGRITFSYEWDGHLGPLEQDTVSLIKVMSNVTLFEPPCNKYVRVWFILQKDSKILKDVRSDSLLFLCVF